MLYTLNLYSAVCQSYLNKLEGKNILKIKKKKDIGTLYLTLLLI